MLQRDIDNVRNALDYLENHPISDDAKLTKDDQEVLVYVSTVRMQRTVYLSFLQYHRHLIPEDRLYILLEFLI